MARHNDTILSVVLTGEQSSPLEVNAVLYATGSATNTQGSTLVKLIVDSASQCVLGAHMVGADSPEIIQGLATAISMGATKSDFDATVVLHPSAAEEFVTLRTKSTRTKNN